MPAEVEVLETPIEKPNEGSEPKVTPPPEVKPEVKPDAPAEKKPDETSPEKPKAESLLDKKTEAEKPVVPEKYADFKLPEGQKIDPEFMGKAQTVFKELGLTQENAQKLVSLQAENTAAQIKQTMDVYNKQIADWTAETKKELGADTEKALSVASKGIDEVFKDPAENKQFREMMKESGLGNWKLMVKAFSYVGGLVREDKLVDGKPATDSKKTDAEVLFDHPTSRPT